MTTAPQLTVNQLDTVWWSFNNGLSAFNERVLRKKAENLVALRDRTGAPLRRVVANDLWYYRAGGLVPGPDSDRVHWPLIDRLWGVLADAGIDEVVGYTGAMHLPTRTIIELNNPHWRAMFLRALKDWAEYRHETPAFTGFIIDWAGGGQPSAMQQHEHALEPGDHGLPHRAHEASKFDEIAHALLGMRVGIEPWFDTGYRVLPQLMLSRLLEHRVSELITSQAELTLVVDDPEQLKPHRQQLAEKGVRLALRDVDLATEGVVEAILGAQAAVPVSGAGVSG